MTGRYNAVRASVTLGASASEAFIPSDFTSLDGDAIGNDELVIVEQIAYSAACDVDRLGDPDGDDAFEIEVNVGVLSSAEASIMTALALIVDNHAALQVTDTSGGGAEVVLVGRVLNVGQEHLLIEQNDTVANGSEIARTIGGHAQEETIVELVMSGDATLHFRADADDDGTNEFDSQVASYTGAQVRLKENIGLFDEAGRSNAEMELALQASGGSRDLMMIGTIGA